MDQELEKGVEYYLDSAEVNTGFFVEIGVDKGRNVIWFEQGNGSFYDKSPNGLIGFPVTGRKYKKATT